MAPRGYPDYQRVQNWDGPEVLNNFTVENTGKVESGVVECSRYGYLIGSVGVGTNPVVLKIEYFYDQAATQFIGIRQMVLDPGVLNTGQVNLPNLGPFMKVIVKPSTEATKWEGFIRLFLSNRLSPTELRIPTPLLALSEPTFAKGETLVLPLNGYFSGPARLWVFVFTAATLLVQVSAATAINKWDEVDRVETTTSKVALGAVVLPTTANRLELTSSGAGGGKVVLTPFTTGAS